MGLTNERVSTLFDAGRIVGESPTVGVSGAGGGQGLGGVGPDTYVATSSGIHGRLGDIRAAQASAGAVGADESAGAPQSGGRRSRRRRMKKHRRTLRSRRRITRVKKM